MKKLLLPLLALLFLTACEKERVTVLENEQELHENISAAKRGPATKVNVCHDGNVISVSRNAWPAHLQHGDVQLIDADGDGYVTAENDCGLPVDCDDTNDQVTICCPGIEIAYNGPLYVAPEDEAGNYNWQAAKNRCTAKAQEDGCGWFLPNKAQLNAVYQQLGPNGSGEITTGLYWSSTEFSAFQAWFQAFNSGGQGFSSKVVGFRCRCVRR